jgi:hypothetical protein
LSSKLNFFKHVCVLPFAITKGFKEAPPDEIVNPRVKFSFGFSLHSIFTDSEHFSLIAVLGGFIILQLVSS